MGKKRDNKAQDAAPKPDTDELIRKLQSVLYGLNHILDTVIVCSHAAEARSDGELHEEMESVLRRHVSDPLFGELIALNKVVVALGGPCVERFDQDDDDE